jgi:hypothetical protein
MVDEWAKTDGLNNAGHVDFYAQRLKPSLFDKHVFSLTRFYKAYMLIGGRRRVCFFDQICRGSILINPGMQSKALSVEIIV